MHPWNLLHLIESVYRESSFPKFPNNPPQLKSFADLHHILHENTFFMVGVGININKHFYDEDSPKFPLSVNMKLDHVGKSSKRLLFQLYHNDVATEYATVQWDDVLVSDVDLKPVAYPAWWMEKFAHL